MTRLSLGNYALIAAGIVAIVSAAPAAHALGSGEELQYVSTTSVQMPGILKMFMHKAAADTTSTTTISATRTRHDDGKGVSTIVQCDLRRIVTVDDNTKTYTVVDFDDMMKQLSTALSQAQAKAGESASTVHGTGNTTVSFDEKPDSQTQVIAGMTAHHAVDTITISMQGSGDCPSGSQSMTMDVWYASSPVKMSCPTKMAAPQVPARGSSPCMQNMMFQANNVRSSQARIPLKTTMSYGAGPMTFGTTTTVSSVKTMPYDPSYFDVPAGYTKVEPSPPPSHR
ncbi:MAG TPA: hypothetical protein VID19_08670 [Candidatus Eremiobacteraceae bacterium]|jgi:hypothetical protein